MRSERLLAGEVVQAFSGQGLAGLAARGVEGFRVHLDADVLDDAAMPAVDYRMPDGLWPEELTEALAAGMEVTIYNPAFDNAERAAARALARAVTAAFATATEPGRRADAVKRAAHARRYTPSERHMPGISSQEREA